MRADPKRIKLLFKTNIQLANSNNGQRWDERHNMEIDGLMHNRDAKITDFVREHLHVHKRKNHNGNGVVGVGSRNEKRDNEGGKWNVQPVCVQIESLDPMLMLTLVRDDKELKELAEK
jgi:hypothetical protein